jgi:hypothetical protein
MVARETLLLEREGTVPSPSNEIDQSVIFMSSSGDEPSVKVSFSNVNVVVTFSVST